MPYIHATYYRCYDIAHVAICKKADIYKDFHFIVADAVVVFYLFIFLIYLYL